MDTKKSGTDKYGALYWCIKTSLSNSGEIYAMADEVQIGQDGTLTLVRMSAGKAPSINLAIAPGNWTACYAASLIGGAAVAVEHWDGEVVR